MLFISYFEKFYSYSKTKLWPERFSKSDSIEHHLIDSICRASFQRSYSKCLTAKAVSRVNKIHLTRFTNSVNNTSYGRKSISTVNLERYIMSFSLQAQRSKCKAEKIFLIL